MREEIVITGTIENCVGFPVIMNVCDSSNIAEIGYNFDNKYLRIDFKNGSRYAYYYVPEDIYTALMESPSRGAFLAKNIKGKFECRNLGARADSPGDENKDKISENNGGL